MDPSIRGPNIPFHFSSYGQSVSWKRFFFALTLTVRLVRKKSVKQTTSLFVTLAATIPNARTYSDVYFSKMPSMDFSEIMNAGNTTAKNGNIGDITLVPYSWTFKELIRNSFIWPQYRRQCFTIISNSRQSINYATFVKIINFNCK